MAFILTLGCLFLIYIYNLCQLVGPSLKFEWNRLVSPRFEWTLKFERSPRFEGITLRSPRIECFTYFWGWSSTWKRPPFRTRHFQCIFMNEKFCISVRISLTSVPEGQIDNNSALVEIMAWRRTGAKPLPQPMLTQFTDGYMWHKGRWVWNHAHIRWDSVTSVQLMRRGFDTNFILRKLRFPEL